MRQRLSIAALIPFALAASLAANVSTEPQAPEAGRPGTASQDQAKPSAKASLSASARKIPCKTPENASLCYWTHGRLAVYNGGAPNFRLWKIGTRRIVGVFSGPSRFPPKVEEADESPELPAELLKAYEADNRRLKKERGINWAFPPTVFGDFEVCPLEPEKKGEMQAVCIESAKNIFIEKDY